MPTAYYLATSIVFGVLLFFPVRSFILAINVNRHQRKLKRAITEEEREVLKRKVTPWAAFIAISFAFLYNKFILFNFLSPKP